MMGCGAEPPLVPVCPIVLACAYIEILKYIVATDCLF